MCSSYTNSVEHYYNDGYRSILISKSNPSIGISNAQVDVVGDTMNCSYTRQNSFNNKLYFDTNKYYGYIVIAYGKGNMNKSI